MLQFNRKTSTIINDRWIIITCCNNFINRPPLYMQEMMKEPRKIFVKKMKETGKTVNVILKQTMKRKQIDILMICRE